jgi:putative addiction module killer protein
MFGEQWTVEHYLTPQGKCPFRDWFDNLSDIKTAAILERRITRLELGNFGNCEPVGAGLFEQKIDYGPGYRIYFGKTANKIILLLLGGDKSTQREDILKAQHYWQDFKENSS